MGRFTGEYSKCDPYNRSNGRNVDNANTDEYNCAGFALRTYSWYCPNENPLREIFEDYFERGRDDFDGIMITSGYDDNSNLKVLELVNKYPNVYGTLGIHPEEANNDYNLNIILDNIDNNKIVAIGEIGLDYHYINDNK